MSIQSVVAVASLIVVACVFAPWTILILLGYFAIVRTARWLVSRRLSRTSRAARRASRQLAICQER